MDFDKLIAKISPLPETIKTDSRQVKPGDIFIAIKGYNQDGHKYILEALKNGAAYSLCEHNVEGVPEEEREKLIIVENSRKTLGEITRRAFRDPSDSLLTYGVTGTNGKTTTVYLIDSILNLSDRASGFISTVAVKSTNGDLKRADMTTPDVVSINKLLSEMSFSGKKAAVIEISSHALSQGRIHGIKLDYAVFTNITPEHMDYHKNMESYLNDKARIFDALKENGTGVLNGDDPAIRELAAKKGISKKIMFGLDKNVNVRAEEIDHKKEHTRFVLNTERYGKIEIITQLLGTHNVYNIIAAAGCLLDSGIGLDKIKEGVERFSGVPGRLQEVFSDASFRVFVDYAHTPVAIENVLKCLRKISDKKLICVFGCGGDRDREKRPVMGEIVSFLADNAILTNDNPRTERSAEIISQVKSGMKNGNEHIIIEPRREAIRAALKSAGEGDIVVIAGKGHEDYQIIGEKRLHFDDTEVAKEILKELGYKVHGAKSLKSEV